MQKHPTTTKSYRFPGVQPFATSQSHIFFGREQDTRELYRLIRREPLVVLYSKSGLGKSSLINAGIVPLCQQRSEYQPIVIRFGAWTEDISDTPLSIAKEKIGEGYNASTFLDELLPDDASLWATAKNRQLNGGGRPLLIFDQFEELFIYPDAEVRAFREELAELLYTDIPLRFRRMADRLDNLTEEQEDELETALDGRVLFAIRSDRMHLLHQLSDDLPNILRSMYELRALGLGDARRAIVLPAALGLEGEKLGGNAKGTKRNLPPNEEAANFRTPPFEWTPAALAALLDYLQDPEDGNRVEGILLQMLCQYFEEKKIEGEGLTSLDVADLGNLKDIVEDYYFEKIATLPNEEMQMASRRLIEDGLVMEGENIRLSLHEAQIERQYGVDKDLLEKLVDSRLLRAEPFLRGGYSYELSHDRLVEPVLKAKAERMKVEKEEELREERRKRRKTLAFALAMALVALGAIAIAAWNYSLIQEANELNAKSLEDNQTIRDQVKALTEKEEALKDALEDAKSAKDTAELRQKEAELAQTRAERQKRIADLAKIEVENSLDSLSKKEEELQFALKEAQIAKDTAEIKQLQADLAKKEAEENLEKAIKANFRVTIAKKRTDSLLNEITSANFNIFNSLIDEIETDILNMDYESALDKTHTTAGLNMDKKEVLKKYLEIAFWYNEIGNIQQTVRILNTVDTLIKNEKFLLVLRKSASRNNLREAMQTLDKDYYNFLVLRYYPHMVRINGGTFLMGCDEKILKKAYGEDVQCPGNEPQNEVTLDDFWMAKTETTWWQFGLYRAAKGENPFKDRASWLPTGNHPVVNVNWYDALQYANWVSQQMEQDTVYSGDLLSLQVKTDWANEGGFRLPTEAEWEYAALGGEKYVFAGTNDPDSLHFFGNYDEDGMKDGYLHTAPVKSYRPNNYGLYDMSGNVWEWCWDIYTENYYANVRLAVHGGAWIDSLTDYCRVASRHGNFGFYRDFSTGFRLAKY